MKHAWGRWAACLSLAGCLAVAGCTPPPEPSPTPSSGSPSAPSSPAAPPPPVKAAPWAREITTGAFMWSTSRDGWTVTGFDMGVGEAPRDAYFSDDETDEPLVKKGDPIVFMNLVATNTSDQTLYISIDEPNLWANPVSKIYKNGISQVAPATDQQMRDHGIWYHNVADGVRDSYPYPLEPGESCALGFVLPLTFGAEFVFVPHLWAYETAETTMGHEVRFDQQTYTFPH